MNLKHLLVLAPAVIASGAHAQSAYSIPNPIIRPPSQAIAPQASNPRAVRYDDAAAPSRIPPLPQPIGQAALPGQSMAVSAPTTETVIRETLATFAVTAIVGDSAVLRNYVGFQPMAGAQSSAQAQGQGQYASPAPSANGSTSSLAQQPRQAVIRVKTNVPVFVAGVSLTPTVSESRVEFRLSGKGQIISTVMLESQSVHGYVPPSTQREAIDPAVTARTTPNGGALLQGAGTGYGNGAGASSSPNGLLGTAGQQAPR